MKTEDRIEKKKEEIKNYERILLEYGSGRWLNMGHRHLESLKEELVELEKFLQEESTATKTQTP